MAIEIAEVDGVEIDDVDFTEAGEQETFEQFTADATGTDEKNTGLDEGDIRTCSEARIKSFRQKRDGHTSAMRLESVPTERFR